MKRLYTTLTFLAYFSLCSPAQSVTGPKGEQFSYRVLATNLSDPWEIAYGPDNHLWITEARGYKVSRINPATGARTTLLDLNSAKNFPRYDKIDDNVDGGKPWPQGGLMGLALHPQLLSGKPYVYLAYVYNFSGASSSGNGCSPNMGGCFFKTKLVRYTYNSASKSLSSPVTLCDTIPGSNDHNSGRMLIAPYNGGTFLYYSVGDMGAGQFGNAGRPNKAQNPASYEGKVLRFLLEEDQDNGFDKWIPNDNPYNSIITTSLKNNGRQSAVWSIGHRNAQGLAWATISGITRIYSSEHGPFSDDEINLIERKKNYGHPLVIGFNDGNYNGLAAATTSNTSLPGLWQTSCPTIINENDNVNAIGIDNFRGPIKSLYRSTNTHLTTIMTALKTGNNNGDAWQSEAPSSIEIYTSSAIPGWQNSVLMPTLKGGKLIRYQLNSAGNNMVSDTINYFKGRNRYRDIAISPDGRKIYLAVDSSNVTSGPSSTNLQLSTNRGSILEFTYQGLKTASARQSSQLLQEDVPVDEPLVVYPNPAASRINVSVPQNHIIKGLQYQVTDASGRIIVSKSVRSNNFSENIAQLQTGLYLLKIFTEESKELLGVRKFMKQ